MRREREYATIYWVKTTWWIESNKYGAICLYPISQEVRTQQTKTSLLVVMLLCIVMNIAANKEHVANRSS